MGNVSTALTEEALVKCIKKEPYHPAASASGQSDDVKCSICQVRIEFNRFCSIIFLLSQMISEAGLYAEANCCFVFFTK